MPCRRKPLLPGRGGEDEDVNLVVRTIKDLLRDGSAAVVHRGRQPVNEFNANAFLIHGSFPNHFMHGKGVTRNYGMTEEDTRHLLLQWDRRFAEDKDFVLLLFNQKIRHAGLRSVHDKIKTNTRMLAAFERAVNMPNIHADLDEASRNPSGATARRLLADFLPVLRSCHAAVPFSTSERFAVRGKLRAMVDFFGLPSIFLTVAPNDTDNELILALSLGKERLLVRPPSLSERFEALSKNPVAAARVQGTFWNELSKEEKERGFV
jgi:hypothetical protein